MDSATEKAWTQNQRPNQPNGTTLVLEPVNDTFQQKRITLVEGSCLKIGRMTSKTTAPTDSNGYFDSKVLSRSHAEISYHNNQLFIKDQKSSNGTFINGKRLSAEGKESGLIELKHGDNLEFGVDIVNEPDKKLLFRKVAAKVYLSQTGSDMYDAVITGVEPQKTLTNGHMSIKRRGNRALQAPSNTENSLFAMLEAELVRARVESQYLSEIGNTLNDATNTLDARSKRVHPSDSRFYEESHAKLEEVQTKLRETEERLNEAIYVQREYKEKFMASDKNFYELKQRYMDSEKRGTELERKYMSSEKRISELEQMCMISDEKVIQLEQKCKESDQKAIELEEKCRESESRIQVLEDALQNTVNTQTKSSKFEDLDLEKRLTKITNELSDAQYLLDETREQLKRTEQELHLSQEKCRELEAYAAKYNDANDTIKELRSLEELLERQNKGNFVLLSCAQFLEESANKNGSEYINIREQLKKIESLNKRLQEKFDMRVEEEVARRIGGGLFYRHKKQDSEPVKECEITGEHSEHPVAFAKGNMKHDFSYDRKFNKLPKKSLLIKGSIGIVVLGIGTWCLTKFYA